MCVCVAHHSMPCFIPPIPAFPLLAPCAISVDSSKFLSNPVCSPRLSPSSSSRTLCLPVHLFSYAQTGRTPQVCVAQLTPLCGPSCCATRSHSCPRVCAPCLFSIESPVLVAL
eukprot:TRINITY_DN8990_c0_g1_i1.p1 TRINITY_DN8990_c0_g1~~TRINITY_DN8990_c0_g1_i1.p1  ORF type:complete len:113 (-),score=0.92 TRINITY_DN8990_c0_g1_i1:12-350(-)